VVLLGGKLPSRDSGSQQGEGSQLGARRPRPVERWDASRAFRIPVEKKLQDCSKELSNSRNSKRLEYNRVIFSRKKISLEKLKKNS